MLFSLWLLFSLFVILRRVRCEITKKNISSNTQMVLIEDNLNELVKVYHERLFAIFPDYAFLSFETRKQERYALSEYNHTKRPHDGHIYNQGYGNLYYYCCIYVVCNC